MCAEVKKPLERNILIQKFNIDLWYACTVYIEQLNLLPMLYGLFWSACQLNNLYFTIKRQLYYILYLATILNKWYQNEDLILYCVFHILHSAGALLQNDDYKTKTWISIVSFLEILFYSQISMKFILLLMSISVGYSYLLYINVDFHVKYRISCVSMRVHL